MLNLCRRALVSEWMPFALFLIVSGLAFAKGNGWL